MTLDSWLAEKASELQVPGVSVGVLHEGEEIYAYHGVTSIENPLAVDENTLLNTGSTGKPFTATAIMRLVEEGRVALDERVRTYVREFKLRDEDTAARVTVLNCLNHTGGWSGDIYTGTGPGDDSLERFVALMADLPQEFPLGTSYSYNNTGLSLAGRIIEKVTGKTYEQAIHDLIFEPLGLDLAFYLDSDIISRRFSVGHTTGPDGELVVARPWGDSRGLNPAGAIWINAKGLIRWARFHMGDGEGVLSRASLEAMQQPTFDLGGGALGDYVGISWFLRDVDGVRLVSHGGNTTGFGCSFVMAPERDFAIAVLANSAAGGNTLKSQLVRWALEEFIGVKQEDPRPVTRSDDEIQLYAGDYQTIAAIVHLAPKDGGLEMTISLKPETAAQLYPDGVPTQPPLAVRFVEGAKDGFIYYLGEPPGMSGHFVRDEDDAIRGVHIGGRFATRV